MKREPPGKILLPPPHETRIHRDCLQGLPPGGQESASADTFIGPTGDVERLPGFPRHVARTRLGSEPANFSVGHRPRRPTFDRLDGVGESVAPHVSVSDDDDLGLGRFDGSIDRLSLDPRLGAGREGQLPIGVTFAVGPEDPLLGPVAVLTAAAVWDDDRYSAHGSGSKTSVGSLSGSSAKKWRMNQSRPACSPPSAISSPYSRQCCPVERGRSVAA